MGLWRSFKQDDPPHSRSKRPSSTWLHYQQQQSRAPILVAGHPERRTRSSRVSASRNARRQGSAGYAGRLPPQLWNRSKALTKSLKNSSPLNTRGVTVQKPPPTRPERRKSISPPDMPPSDSLSARGAQSPELHSCVSTTPTSIPACQIYVKIGRFMSP